jgi:hypothetical protein
LSEPSNNLHSTGNHLKSREFHGFGTTYSHHKASWNGFPGHLNHLNPWYSRTRKINIWLLIDRFRQKVIQITSEPRPNEERKLCVYGSIVLSHFKQAIEIC